MENGIFSYMNGWILWGNVGTYTIFHGSFGEEKYPSPEAKCPVPRNSFSTFLRANKNSSKMKEVLHSGNMIHHQISIQIAFPFFGDTNNNRGITTIPCKVCMSKTLHVRGGLGAQLPGVFVAELVIWKCQCRGQWEECAKLRFCLFKMPTKTFQASPKWWWKMVMNPMVQSVKNSSKKEIQASEIGCFTKMPSSLQKKSGVRNISYKKRHTMFSSYQPQTKKTGSSFQSEVTSWPYKSPHNMG